MRLYIYYNDLMDVLLPPTLIVVRWWRIRSRLVNILPNISTYKEIKYYIIPLSQLTRKPSKGKKWSMEIKNYIIPLSQLTRKPMVKKWSIEIKNSNAFVTVDQKTYRQKIPTTVHYCHTVCKGYYDMLRLKYCKFFEILFFKSNIF